MPEQPEHSSFASRIKARRQELKLSQAAVALKMGNRVTPTAVGQWESANNFPSANHIKEFAAALGWTVEELIAGTELNVEQLRYFTGKENNAARGETINASEVENPDAYRKAIANAVFSSTLNVFILGNGRINNAEAPGSIPTFMATLICPETFDAVYLAWAEALIETSSKLRIDTTAALNLLQEQHPSWVVQMGQPKFVSPDL